MTNDVPKIKQIGIKINGADLDHQTLDELIDVEVDSSLYVPDMVTLRFHDETLELTDSSKFNPGNPIQIDLPDPSSGNLTPVFKGEITAIEPDFNAEFRAVLTIRGYDKSHRLNRGTKTDAYLNASDSDIVSKVLQQSGTGLSAQVESTSPVHEHVFQDNQTDLDFIHYLAQRNGFEVFVDDTRLYFRKPQGGRGDITLIWGEDLQEFRPRMRLTRQVNEVTVKGWDPEKKAKIIGQASSSKISPVIGNGGWGGQAAQSAFSAATQVEVRRPVVSQAQADKVAQAILDDVNAGYIEADGTAFGNPELVAGKKVDIQKVGTKFSGKYVVTSATHVYGGGKYYTYFNVEGARRRVMSDLVSEPSPHIQAGDFWGGVVPAVVTNNVPDKDWGQVKVKFPWFDDRKESHWARISSIGAGKQRGIYWMPEVDDEVLVAFEHGDFNRPIVIGGLWNGKDAPPEAKDTVVQGGKVETRVLKTREGHVIRFNDKSGEQKIEIIDAKTNTQIILDTQNKKIEIVSKGDITLDAQSQGNLILQAGGDVTLKGKNVKVEANMNLDLKGNNSNMEATLGLNLKGLNSKLEGSGTVDVSSSGMTNIKGTMVNIN